MDKMYYVNFNTIPKPIRRFRFKELQTLAFSKGIGWIGAGMNYQTYGGGAFSGREVEICIHCAKPIRGKNKFLGYGSNDNLISYRDMIKKLRALQ